MRSHWSASNGATAPTFSSLTPPSASAGNKMRTRTGTAGSGFSTFSSSSSSAAAAGLGLTEASSSGGGGGGGGSPLSIQTGSGPGAPSTDDEDEDKDGDGDGDGDGDEDQGKHTTTLPPWSTCPFLPLTIRYARPAPTRDPYLPPSERAALTQRAALLEAPFSIQNVDWTSGGGAEGRKASLVLAIERGTRVEMVAWLLEMGHEADGPSADDDNNSVFALAAIYNRCDVIELYSAHPDVDVPALISSKSTSEGRTALHWAAMKGHDEVIRRLLSLGADVDAFDANLNTPLHFASAWGHLTSVQLLKEVGARSDLVNKQGFRALDWAFDGNIKIVLETFGEPVQRIGPGGGGANIGAGTGVGGGGGAAGGGHAHTHSYASSSHGSDGSTSTGAGAARSPSAAALHLPDLKVGAPAPGAAATNPSSGSGLGSAAGAEVGNARSVLMSRDQAAMMQYRRAIPRSTTPGLASASASASPSAGAAGGGVEGMFGASGILPGGGGGGSPLQRPLALRGDSMAGAASSRRRSTTLSPAETLRAGVVMPRSPPTSPPAQMSHLR
ncbi:Target of rapamycin complex 2 subunit avo2 [Tilletia horrida]|nr:Target of rapamycin complex 2 subunit avo2 [Tilletia horrida]